MSRRAAGVERGDVAGGDFPAAELRFIMDKLLKRLRVIDIKSDFVLERMKEITALPLAYLA